MAVLKYKNPDTNTWEKLSGLIQLGTDVPVGAICEYAGETMPEDYLQCDGSSLLRTDYPDLFNAIGTTYGSVDSLHFNLPDIKSRTVVGLNSDDSDFNTLGKTGGSKYLQKHSHEMIRSKNTFGSGAYENYQITSASNNSTYKTKESGTGDSGNLQPYITLYYIIKAKTNTYSISKVINNLDSDSSTDSLSANQGRVLNNKIDNLTTVYTGTNITAPTCEGFGKIRKIYGYSTQKTRDGKNKFSLSYIRSSSVFEVTETGVNLKKCWTADIYTHDNLLKVMKPNTIYTMKAKAKVISRPSTILSHQYGTMLLYRPGSSSLGSVVTPVLQMADKETIALNTEKEYITTFTTPADLTDVRFLAYSFYGNNDGSTTGSAQGEIDLTEVMLVEGTYTTETFPDYEPYGVSPSPEYPSEIKNCGNNGSINIKIQNKNLVNAKEMALSGKVDVDENDIITISNNSNPTGYLNTNKKLKDVCPTLKVGDLAYLRLDTTFSKKQIYLSGVNQYWYDGNSKNITQKLLDSNVIFYGGYQISTTMIIQITLNELSDFVKHQEQNIQFNTTKPLYKDCYLAEDGIHYTRKQIVLDGSEDEGWSLSATNTSNQNRFTSKIIENEVKRPSNADEISNIICSHFIKESANETYRRSDGIAIHPNGSIYLYYDAFKEYTISEFKTWLSNNPITLEYELAEEVIEPYTDYTSMLITQYDNTTNIFNSDNAEMEVELTKNKAISSINENIGNLQEKDNDLNDRINDVNTNLNDKINGTILYSSASGTKGTITLSKSSANFKRIGIEYKDTRMGITNYVEVIEPNGKMINLLSFQSLTNKYITASAINISGNAITWEFNDRIRISDGVVVEDQWNLITKVIGYIY